MCVAMVKPSKPGPAHEVAAFLATCRRALLPEPNALRAIVAAAAARVMRAWLAAVQA